MKRILASAALLAMAGCSSEMDELKQFVRESEKGLPRRIEPLPPVKPFEPFTYEGFDLPDPLQRTGDVAISVGVPRNDGDHAQIPDPVQRCGEDACHLGGPQVLILDVDERARAPERLDVGAGDAPLTVGRERIGPASRRIGAEHRYHRLP